MLAASPKGTVPVLVLGDDQVLEESLDIMLWTLKRNDPHDWLSPEQGSLEDMLVLIEEMDGDFKHHLDHYKYADRYPEHPIEYYREQGEDFLQELEERLLTTRFLLSDQLSIADIGLFPFIRQFAMVDQAWFDQSPYPKLRQWLNGFIDSDRFEAGLFSSIMEKYELWKQGDSRVYL